MAREIVGSDLAPPIAPRARTPGDVVLSVKNLQISNSGVKVGPLNFEVRAGEIVAIAGVSGNGQSELVHGLSGLRSLT
ncbi:heme ABC transporter ATP-binding protein, partial [Aeromonas veronii]